MTQQISEHYKLVAEQLVLEGCHRVRDSFEDVFRASRPDLADRWDEAQRAQLKASCDVLLKAIADDYGKSGEQLDAAYNSDGDGQHLLFKRWDWHRAVAQGATLRGYWDWVASQLEQVLEQ